MEVSSFNSDNLIGFDYFNILPDSNTGIFEISRSAVW